MTASARHPAGQPRYAAPPSIWYDKDGNCHASSRRFAVTNAPTTRSTASLTRTYPADSTLNVAYTYDQTAGHGNGIGHLTSLTDQAGSLSLSLRGARPAHQSTPARSAATPTPPATPIEAPGVCSAITYAVRGWMMTYARDSGGQVSSVTATQPPHSPVNLATSVTHMPFGPVASLTYGNGITDTRTYDLDYRMTGVKDTARRQHSVSELRLRRRQQLH